MSSKTLFDVYQTSYLKGRQLHIVGKYITEIGRVPLELATKVNVLYLSNNCLQSVEYIDQFQNVEILSLTGNLLSSLHILEPLTKLRALHTVNFEQNPITTYPHYRSYVINKLKDVQTLDSVPITDQERHEALANVQQDQSSQHMLFENHCRLHQLQHLARIIKLHTEIRETRFKLRQQKLVRSQPEFDMQLYLRFWDYKATLSREEVARIKAGLRDMVVRTTRRLQQQQVAQHQTRELREKLEQLSSERGGQPAQALRMTDLWRSAYGQVLAVQQNSIAKLMGLCESFLIHAKERERVYANADPQGLLRAIHDQEEIAHREYITERSNLIKHYQAHCTFPTPSAKEPELASLNTRRNRPQEHQMLSNLLPPQQIDPDAEDHAVLSKSFREARDSVSTPSKRSAKSLSPRQRQKQAELNRCGYFPRMTLGEAVNRFEFRHLDKSSDLKKHWSQKPKTLRKPSVFTPPYLRSKAANSRDTSPLPASKAPSPAAHLKPRKMQSPEASTRPKSPDGKQVNRLLQQLQERDEMLERMNQANDQLTHRLEEFQHQNEENTAIAQAKIQQLESKLANMISTCPSWEAQVRPESKQKEKLVDMRFFFFFQKRLILTWHRQAKKRRLLRSFCIRSCAKTSGMLLCSTFVHWKSAHSQTRKITLFERQIRRKVVAQVMRLWSEKAKLMALCRLACTERKQARIKHMLLHSWRCWTTYTDRNIQRNARLQEHLHYRILHRVFQSWRSGLESKNYDKQLEIGFIRQFFKVWQSTMQHSISPSGWRLNPGGQHQLLHFVWAKWKRFRQDQRRHQYLVWKARGLAYDRLQLSCFQQWKVWAQAKVKTRTTLAHHISRRAWAKWRQEFRQRVQYRRQCLLAERCRLRQMYHRRLRLFSAVFHGWCKYALYQRTRNSNRRKLAQVVRKHHLQKQQFKQHQLKALVFNRWSVLHYRSLKRTLSNREVEQEKLRQQARQLELQVRKHIAAIQVVEEDLESTKSAKNEVERKNKHMVQAFDTLQKQQLHLQQQVDAYQIELQTKTTEAVKHQQHIQAQNLEYEVQLKQQLVQYKELERMFEHENQQKIEYQSQADVKAQETNRAFEQAIQVSEKYKSMLHTKELQVKELETQIQQLQHHLRDGEIQHHQLQNQMTEHVGKLKEYERLVEDKNQQIFHFQHQQEHQRMPSLHQSTPTLRRATASHFPSTVTLPEELEHLNSLLQPKKLPAEVPAPVSAVSMPTEAGSRSTDYEKIHQDIHAIQERLKHRLRQYQSSVPNAPKAKKLKRVPSRKRGEGVSTSARKASTRS